MSSFFLLTFLSTLSLSLSQILTCSTSTYDIDWSAGNSQFHTEMKNYAWNHMGITECNDESVCGAVDISGTFTTTTTLFGWDIKATKSFEVDHEFCTDTLTCNLFGDGIEGECVTSNYYFQYWQPLSCNEAKDFNAITIDYNLTTKFLCCNTENCNSDLPFDQLNCPEDDTLSNYLKDLYRCWNNVKKQWQTDIYCNKDNYAINYYKECCVYGDCAKKCHDDWRDSKKKRRKQRCEYKATCSSTLENILTDFGTCACDAAKENNYDGAVINELMGTHWEDFCPNVIMTCDSDGELSLKKYFFYAKYVYYLNIDPDLADYYADKVWNHLVNETGNDNGGVTPMPVPVPIPGVPTSEPTPAPFAPTTNPPGPQRRRRLTANKIHKSFAKVTNFFKRRLSNEKIEESFRTLPSLDVKMSTLGAINDDSTSDTVDVGYVISLQYQTQRDMNYMVGWLDENADGIILDATGINPSSSYTASEKKSKLDVNNEESKKSSGNRIIYGFVSMVLVVIATIVLG